VTRLVYDTFEGVVFDASKDVLVTFCRPDVDSCRKLAELLPRVALELAHEASFVVATMDMSQNDEPRHSIRSIIYGYPTIKFFPAKDKKALVFEAPSITVDGIVSFMRDKAVNFKPAPLPRPDLKDLQRRLGDQGTGVLDSAQHVLEQHVRTKRERERRSETEQRLHTEL